MANNFSEFCIELEHLTPAELNWWTEMNTKIDLWIAGGSPDLKIPEGFTAETMPEFMPCDITVQDTSVILADDGGECDLELVGYLLQRYLITFQPDRHAFLEVAFLCSKHRPNEFGGAAAFVTADEVRWMNTGSWIAEQVKDWSNGRPVTCDNCNARSEVGWGDTPLCLNCQRVIDPTLVCEEHQRTHEGSCPLGDKHGQLELD